MPDNIRPLPEFIPGQKGAGWKVTKNIQGGGYCAPGQRLLSVPTDGECVYCGHNHAQGIRNHELAHAVITGGPNNENPRLPDDLSLDYFQVAEDMRVYRTLDSGFADHQPSEENLRSQIQNNPAWRGMYQSSDHYDAGTDHGYGKLPGYEDSGYYLTEKGHKFAQDNGVPTLMNEGERIEQPPVLCRHDKERWKEAFKKMSDKDRVLWMLAAGDADAAMVREIAKEVFDGTGDLGMDYEMAMRISHAAHSEMDEKTSDYKYPTLEDSVRVAQLLQAIFGKLENPEEDMEEGGGEGGGAGYEDGMGNPLDMNGDPIEEANGPLEAERGGNKTRTGKGTKSKHFGAGDGEWDPMKIKEVPLVVELPGHLRRTKRQNDQGGSFNQAWRWKMDRKVFQHTRKLPGGTVLVDDSGSMNLTHDTIMAILEHAPGATVAMYSGSDHDGYGELRIVARGGKACAPSDAKTPWGGNQVDGPALEWLNKQEGPRIWISDGQVVGTHGQTAACLLERDLLLKRGKVCWIDTNFFGQGEAMEKATLKALATGKVVRNG